MTNTFGDTLKSKSMIHNRSHTSRPLPGIVVLAASAGLALLLTSTNSAAAQAYTITNLGTLGIYSQANGLSANGTAVGYSTLTDGSTNNAFLTPPSGAIQDLGTLSGMAGTNSAATGIATGAVTQVVGYSDTGVGATQHAFLYTAGGVGGPADNPQMRDLGTLSGVGTDFSLGFGVNALGQVVGVSVNSGGEDHAFRTGPNLNINGATDDLGTLGGINSSATSINAAGQVVGNAALNLDVTHAFRTAPNASITAASDLGTLGGINSNALGINASGQVVGQSDLASADPNAVSRHAFVWTQGATTGAAGNMQMTDLGSLGGDSTANGINDAGSIVGFSFLADGTMFDAFLYRNNQMVDLNSLIDPASGWVLQNATAINNNGQIAGYGLFNGQTRAFLLNAAPEPSAPCVLAIGLGALGLLAARKRRISSAR